MRTAASAFLWLMLLTACTSVLDKPEAFRLIQPEDGWVRIGAPPADSAAMIAVDKQSEHIQELLKDSSYRGTWFQRGTKDYLVYFQEYRHRSDNDCGDQAYEFVWKDTRWEVGDFNELIVCG